MSVINQMLKDLDKRQQTERLPSDTVKTTIVPEAKKLSLPVIITVILVINIAGIAIWQLYSENQLLKANSRAVIAEKMSPIAHGKSAEQVQGTVPTIADQVKTKVAETKPLENKQSQSQPSKAQNDAELMASVAQQDAGQDKLQSMPANSVENTVESLVSTLNKQSDTVPSSAPSSSSELNTEQQEAELLPAAGQQQNKSQLTISRKQLSAQELVEQKLSQAQQALNRDQVSRAETLFEDVLLVSPENKTARKQLAALWFGRKSYQAAHNLLAQGIAIAPDDGEYRIMKARIYLSQGQQSAALDVLKVLPSLENVEYQALLATNAQQLAQYDVAIAAYRLLTQLQPENGRWWLGLAVAYDSNSQFDNAASAYHQAKDNSELSTSARQFARQRLQELGE